MRRLVAAVAVVGLVLGAAAGCGGDDGGAAPPSTAPPVSATASLGPANELPPVDGPFAPGRTQIPGFGEVEVRIVDGPDGEPVVLCVLLAETREQRSRGLMEVTDPELGGYDGMLFTYEDDSTTGFWMRDTPLPLSIAYLDAEGATVDTADMEPCLDRGSDCPSHRPSGPYRMALEVPRGGLDHLGLAPGSPARLEVEGACGPAG